MKPRIVYSSDPKTKTKGVDMCHGAFQDRGYDRHLFDTVRLDTDYLSSVAQAIERRPTLSIWTNGVSCGAFPQASRPSHCEASEASEKAGCMMNQNTKNYVRFLKQLKDARTQEDVDAIVKASHNTLTPHSFGLLLAKVLKRRNELPDRDAVQ